MSLEQKRYFESGKRAERERIIALIKSQPRVSKDQLIHAGQLITLIEKEELH
jgi:hypothetical protein